jgi:hypothetical protein
VRSVDAAKISSVLSRSMGNCLAVSVQEACFYVR